MPICGNHFKFAEHYSIAFGCAEVNGFLRLSKQVVFSKHVGCRYELTIGVHARLAAPVSGLGLQHQYGSLFGYYATDSGVLASVGPFSQFQQSRWLQMYFKREV